MGFAKNFGHCLPVDNMAWITTPSAGGLVGFLSDTKWWILTPKVTSLCSDYQISCMGREN